MRERKTTRGPRWWVVNSSKIDSVEQVGQQPVGGVRGARPVVVVDGVLHDPHRQHLFASALVGRGDELGKEGPVGQALQNGQDGVALGPPQQCGASGGDRGEQRVGGEAAVSQDQHVGLQRHGELLGQGHFPDRIGVHRRGDDRVRAALTQGHDPDLRERAAVPAPGPGPAEHASVGGRVGVGA